MVNYDEHIGVNIRNARKKAGISQSKLADKCNLSNTMLSNYETGKIVPSLTTLAKIAKQLNVTIDRLYYGDETEAFITSETNKGRKIVNAVYYLWEIGLVSFYAGYYSSGYGANQSDGPTGWYLSIREYIPQIQRLITQLDEYKKNKGTYDEPEKYLEFMLSSVANEINGVDVSRVSMEAKKQELLQKLHGTKK